MKDFSFDKIDINNFIDGMIKNLSKYGVKFYDHPIEESQISQKIKRDFDTALYFDETYNNSYTALGTASMLKSHEQSSINNSTNSIIQKMNTDYQINNTSINFSVA